MNGEGKREAQADRETRSPLIQDRTRYVSLLRDSLREIVACLSALEEVERVSVFGSYARGRADLFTDLDILVVMRTEQGFVDRLKRLYSLVPVPVDLDLLCYTPEEFQAMTTRPFFQRMLQSEVVLHEKKRA